MVSASVDVPNSVSDFNLKIYSEDGQLMDDIPLGAQQAGEMVFRWDGLNTEVNGELLDWRSSQDNGASPGNYRFELSSLVDGQETALNTALSANVNSVTVGANGQLTLNLAGIGAVAISDVKQFNE